MDDLANPCRGWVEESLRKGHRDRDRKWTESVAVGSEAFVAATKERLGIKAKGREVIGGEGVYELRESSGSYESILGRENGGLSLKNAYFWDDND